MSEEKKYLTIEDEINDKLSGEMQKNALSFAAYVQAIGLTLDGVWNGAYVYHYKGKCICLIGIPPFWDVIGWNIYGFDYNTVYDDFPVDEDLKEFAYANVKPCAVAIGGECGCGIEPGIRANVFGKEFDGTCCHVTKFENPDADALEKITKLVQVWKHCIDNKKEENI